jgi:Papain family cysteine protease
LKYPQRIADCGFRIADCGLRNVLIINGIRNPQSTIRNPQSTIRNPKSAIRCVYFHFVIQNMKTIILFITLILPVLCIAQYPNNYWITPTPQVPLLPNYELESSIAQILPLEHSLKKYCPKPAHQKPTLSSIGYAFGYGAMTLLNAVENHWTDTRLITQNAFSALFPYNIACQHRCEPVSMKAIIDVLQTQGNLPFEQFDQEHPTDCAKIPNQAHHQQAQKFQTFITQVFEDATTEFHKKRLIQKSLLNDLPVVVHLNVSESFAQHNWAEMYYEPNGVLNQPQALVIIGYDEYGFECLNSGGSAWGHDGFCKIRYEHFWNLCKEAYQVQFKKTLTEPMHGFFELRTAESGGMMPIDWTLKSDGSFKYYETKRPLSEVRSYQLVVRRLQRALYVYVLSVNAQGHLQILWPEKGWDITESSQTGATLLEETSFVPYNNSYFVLPRLANTAKTVHYIILYSKKFLSKATLAQRIKRFQTGPKELTLTHFEHAFKDLLATPNEVHYNAKQVAFDAPNVKDEIVPILLKVHTKVD